MDFLYEGHTDFDAPEPCTRVDRSTRGNILHSFWISDAEMAAFLQETYPGMPVRYADFTYDEQAGDAGFTELQWTWQHEGEEKSGLTVLYDEELQETDPFHWRYFWWNGSSASYMNITEDYMDGPSNYLARSNMNPPMLMADWPLQDPAITTAMFNATVTADIRVFEDLECENEA